MKICAVAVLLCLSRLATADEITLDRTCIEIDGAHDGLAAPDRERTSELLRRVLERENLLVVTGACTETYVLSHERTADGYIVRMRSSAGKRRMTMPALDELSSKYERLVRSLLDAKAAQQQQPSANVAAIEAQPAAATFHNPGGAYPMIEGGFTEQVAAPSMKRNLWYVNVGLQVTGGAGVALGFRRAFSSVSLDLAINIRSSDGGAESTTFSAELLRYKPLSANVKGFFGGGLSAGSISRGDPTVYYGDSSDYYWGEGIHGELSAGLHVGKAHGMQLLTQIDITLPFYRVGNEFGMKDYTAAAVVSGGLGF